MAIYAVADLHGRLDAYRAIKNFIKPEDKVYVLGDCGDRGPDPWETIKAVYRDPQFIYLKGNHEDMLVKAIREFVPDEVYGEAYDLLTYNGGYETFEGWMLDDYRTEWYHMLKDLPLYKEYINAQGLKIQLSHAGFTPCDTLPTDHDIVWSRDHFYDGENEGYENYVCIHGHTPIPHLWKRLNEIERWADRPGLEPWDGGAFWYCNNHKICIDGGAYHTGIVILLDLDTFDEHIFDLNQ